MWFSLSLCEDIALKLVTKSVNENSALAKSRYCLFISITSLMFCSLKKAYNTSALEEALPLT